MSRSTSNTSYQLLLSAPKTTRQRMGVSQAELAGHLGNTQTFVSTCERGERRIDAVQLVEFAEALGVEPQELLSEDLDRHNGSLFANAKKTRNRSWPKSILSCQICFEH